MDLLHVAVGEEVVAYTVMQEARAGADESQHPHGGLLLNPGQGFWGFPGISEERKRALTCIVQRWVGEAELGRKQLRSILPFSFLM